MVWKDNNLTTPLPGAAPSGVRKGDKVPISEDTHRKPDSYLSAQPSKVTSRLFPVSSFAVASIFVISFVFSAELSQLTQQTSFAEVPRAGESNSGPESPDHHASQVVDRLRLQSFKENIEHLSSLGDRAIGPGSTDPLPNSNSEAADWIQGELEAMGYQVERNFFGGDGSEWSSIFATKVGTILPNQMYILSAHLDGRGGGGGADDDASGCSLVLEAARAMADSNHVETGLSVRFAFWNAGEGGNLGSSRYVQDRVALQGIEDPPGSGAYPEPYWLAVIQHDMILYDHGLPPEPEQIEEADLDIAWAIDKNPLAGESMAFAELFLAGNARYSTDYPAEGTPSMCCTDTDPFMPHTRTVSVSENRLMGEISEGSNPYRHTPMDVYETYSEADFRLGFNALQMTVGTICELADCASTLAPIFEDGFESGDTTSWSLTAP